MHIVLQLCYILCNRMTSMLYPLISRSYNMQSIFKFLYSDNWKFVILNISDLGSSEVRISESFKILKFEV